ncbi:hypothetical protein [Halobellus captivus]|uniref:hypothetical protein n=1 Tax=Halobellus captivus TaxID=2592614 RepID=UPI0011A9C683|nr:hypothetical protein [Halobellus captivus]
MTEEETADADEPTVPIVCEACDTTSRVPLSELRDSIDTHNDHRHDGDEIAQVDPILADALADAVADDLGLFEE